jgi:outer membrane autotransporter protein
VLTPPSCCPGRPAHSRSRAFFRAAATLALVAGGVSGSLSTQAMAVDYTNPLGNTDTGVYMWGPNNSFSNAGNVIQSSTYYGGGLGDDSGLMLNGAHVTTVLNSGVISASSTGTLLPFARSETRGVFLNGASVTTFTNSGIITASSSVSVSGPLDVVGIYLNGGTITTLNNSGTISAYYTGSGGGFGGAMHYAIFNNGGTIGTLNILDGSSIIGGFQNFGTIGTLNVYKTITNANFDSLIIVPTITGNQPGATNLYLTTPGNCKYVNVGGHAAGVDTSAFGANTNAIRQVSNSVARLADTNGLIQSIGAKASKQANSPYAMTSDLCADGTPTPAAQIGNSDFWVRGFTGRNNVDASASSVNYINSYSGGAVGVDRDWSEDVRGGVFIGAGTMKNSLGGGLGGTDTNLTFAGTYATKTWSTFFAKVGLTGGLGSNTGTRNIASVTPEVAKSDYKSWYVSPELSIGNVYALGQHLGGDFSVTPVLSVRYVYASQDGYTETGATSPLTMKASHSSTVEERAELKFSYATKAFTDYGVKLNASVGGISQQNTGGAMNGTLLGAPLSFATPGQTNSNGFVGGLGFEVNRGKYTFTASGDYVRLSGGNADLSANVVFSVKF